MFDPLQNVEETTSKRSRTTKKAKQRFFLGGCSFDLTSIVSTINHRHGDLFLEPPRNRWKKSGVLCEAIASSSAWLGRTAVVSSEGVTSWNIWNSFHQGGWLQPIVNWWCGFLGFPYERDCYLRAPLESQITTTGAPNHQVNHSLITSMKHLVWPKTWSLQLGL